MSTPQLNGAQSNDFLLDDVADGTRRALLAALHSRNGTIPTDELATHVTAAINGIDLVDVTRADREPVQTALVHRHLPKLEDVGMIEWAHGEGTVTATDHPVWQEPQFQQLIDVEGDDWDAILSALQARQRRIALAVLAKANSLHREELARRLVARETETPRTDVSDEAVEKALIRLHHHHLPALQQAGLITYEDETVRYDGHPDLQPDWLTDASLASDEPQTEEAGQPTMYTIEGRAAIVARGQELFDRANDELFLMVTTNGLLEEDCVSGLQDAIDRGVDVYVGSQTKAVRDLVREEIPEATIWEPQLDWLNLPPEREKLGRLVFADREAVLIGTLGEGPDADGYRETAITGEGPGNSLAVLFREMLGTRLDHLDMQSEDFHSQIPL